MLLHLCIKMRYVLSATTDELARRIGPAFRGSAFSFARSFPVISEIEVEGVGTLRHLNSWQHVRVRKIKDRENRSIAMVAFGLGLTVKQFKSLPTVSQSAAWSAFNRLTAPAPFLTPETPPRPRLPRKGERVSADQQIEIGRALLEMKEQLPHGHFWPWIEEKSGLSTSQARRFIRAASESNAFQEAAE